MKCKECGSAIKADDKYCANCGAEISLQNSTSDYLICENCHHQNLKTNRFCSHCGQPLATRPHSRKKRKQMAKGKKKTIQQQKSTFSKTSFVVIGIVVVFLIYAVKVFFNTKETPSTNTMMELESEIMALETKVLEIASKFNCSCGSCGVTPLETCSCPTANTERNFIREELRKGNSTESVINTVNNIYGHLKPEFEPKDSVNVSS
ncbi:MAG: zinc ribbon domain-containing protein [bacterium]